MTCATRAEERSATESETSHDGTAPDGPKRILVADDEHLVASGLAASLRQMGFTVVGPASDGRGAIELCERERPDLALLDIRMPGMSGLDAAHAIYEQHNVPVIIISAFPNDDYVEDSRDAGVFGYLLKPVARDQLRVMISVAWGRYRTSVEQASQIDLLNLRLEQRKIIEQAKWALVSKGNMTEPEAMRSLQRYARDNRRQLVAVAEEVLQNNLLID